MTPPRLLVFAVLAGLLLLAPVAGAEAQSESPSPSADPSASANQPPVAVPDEASVDAGASAVVAVLGNDTDDGLGRPAGEDARLEVVALRGDPDRFRLDGDVVTFTARSGDTGSYEAEYDVSDGELVATGTITVQVDTTDERTVTISLAARPKALRDYRITGDVRPVGGDRPDVRVQRRTPDGWVRIGTDRSNAKGRYAVPFRTNDPGRHRFRAVAAWPDGARDRSVRIIRTFRAVADPSVSGPLRRAQVRYSWRPGCPVRPSGLRKIHINHLDYRKRVERGAIVVRAGAVRAVVKVLRSALGARFPIRSLIPTDHFYAGGRRTPMESDKAAMRAGNTSAFNCRPVTGNPYRVSQHSYGNAVDVNTIENPYVTGSHVYPEGSRTYLDRSPYRRGMILGGGVVAKRFRGLGWLWGARWSHPDYQHFSSNGG